MVPLNIPNTLTLLRIIAVPVVVVALSRENAVQHYRDVIGATDPAKAADNTIRKLHGTNVGENAVHGSDSEENGIKECAYFFAGHELL